MMPSLTDPEVARLQALASYDILDSLPEEDYDAITRMATEICGMPISTITLVDEHRQWFKSVIGLPNRESSRQHSFCARAIQTPGQLLEIEDTRIDTRFVDNPLTTGDYPVIFYAGVPLVDEDGYALGTLCVIDHKPNKLTHQQSRLLNLLASQVITLLTLRRSQTQLLAANARLQALNEALITANEQHHQTNQLLQAVVDHCPAGLILFQGVREQGQLVDFDYLLTNPVNARVTGLRVDQMIGNRLKTLFPQIGETNLVDRFIDVIETGQPRQYQQHDHFDQIDMWGEFTLVPLGERLLVTFQDITPLKVAESQLRTHAQGLEELVTERTHELSQLTALQQAIVNHAGMAILTTDSAGLIRSANPATESLLGYSAEELPGRPVSSLFDTPTELPPYGPGSAHSLRRKTGQAVPVWLVMTPIGDTSPNGTGTVVIATDITALKRAELALAQKNQELNMFFDVALDLHAIATTDGTLLLVNRAWETTLGFPVDELLGRPLDELVEPSEGTVFARTLQEAVPDKPSFNQLTRFRCQTGGYRLIEWNGVVVDQRFYVSARDMTQRQQHEQQLTRLHQRLQLATQAAQLGVWSFDLTKDEIIWDDALYRLYGLPNTGQPLRLADYKRLIHPEDLPSYQPRHQLPQLEAPRTNQQRIIRPDGQVRWVELHGVRLDNEAGESIGSVGVVQDITDRKAAEAALQQSEQRFRQIAENVDELFWIWDDIAAQFEYVNPAFEHFSGLTLADLQADPGLFQRFITDDHQAALQNALGSSEPNTTLTIQSVDARGRLRWLNVRLFRVGQETSLFTRRIGMASDSTATIERAQILEELLQQERRITALQVQFITTASHEFRTPLTGISSSAELIRFYLDREASTPSTPQVNKHLQSILSKVVALDLLIGDTLMMSKLEEGKLPAHPEETDLVTICETLIESTFSDRADGRQVILSVTGEQAPVWVDRQLLRHVLSNLLGNAFKFSSTDPQLQIIFEVTEVSLHVIDEGIGIPADELPYVFDKFFRARNAGNFQGTGLGLAICEKYTRLLGGQLRVESEEGVRTQFTMTIPFSLS